MYNVRLKFMVSSGPLNARSSSNGRKSVTTISLLAAGKAGQMAGSLVALRLMTSLMTPMAVATVSQFNSIGALVYGLLGYPVTTYFMRHQQEWMAEGSLGRHLASYARYTFSLGLAAGLLFLVVQLFYPVVTGASPAECGIIVAVLCVSLTFFAMGTNGLNVLSRRNAYVLFLNLGAWAAPAFATALFIWITRSPVTWSLGMAIGQGLGAISFAILIVLGSRNRSSAHPQLNLRLIFNFASAQTVSFVFWWAQSQSYRFTLGGLGLANTVGLLAAAQMITSKLTQAFSSVLGDYFTPRIMSHEGSKEESLSNFVDAMIPAVIFFGFILIGMGPELVQLFLGIRFQTVTRFISISAALDTMWGIYNVLYYVCISRIDIRPTIWTMLIGSICTMALVPMLAISWSPLWGTLLAMGVGYSAMGASSLYFISRVTTISWRRILCAILLGIFAMIPVITVGQRNLGILADVAIILILGLFFIAGEIFLARSWLTPPPKIDVNVATFVNSKIPQA